MTTNEISPHGSLKGGSFAKLLVHPKIQLPKVDLTMLQHSPTRPFHAISGCWTAGLCGGSWICVARTVKCKSNLTLHASYASYASCIFMHCLTLRRLPNKSSAFTSTSLGCQCQHPAHPQIHYIQQGNQLTCSFAVPLPWNPLGGRTFLVRP